MTQTVCGVDVSSATLDAFVRPSGARASFANTPDGIEALARFCRLHTVTLVAMEATGGYERGAFTLLDGHGIAVAVLNPRSVRQFATGMGRLEKTDRIDAGMIAWFAEVKRSPPSVLPSAEQRHVRALVTRLRQLTALHTAQLNQQRLITEPVVEASFDELLGLLKRQINDLAAQIATEIQHDPLWRALDGSFRSIRGVAGRTVARLYAELPEIGTLSRKTVSRLAGLAPLANDSGKHRGHRSVRGGRAPVREILFLVAGVAGRYEPDFITFQQKLKQAGKPPKVVRIALAHKLLVRLNAKARDVRNQLATTRQNQPAA